MENIRIRDKHLAPDHWLCPVAGGSTKKEEKKEHPGYATLLIQKVPAVFRIHK
jgi:hypothetical protein